MLARISMYEDSDDIEQKSSGKSQREGLPGVHGKARYKLLVAATKLIKASAHSGRCEISRNVLLLTTQRLIRITLRER